MSLYLLRRIGQSILVVLGVLILTFILGHVEPGSTARATLGLKATPARIALFDQMNGLDKPLPVQFVRYISHAVRGDLGTSFSYYQVPVARLIGQRLPLDVFLLGVSTVIALIIALPVGIYQALRRNRLADDVLGGTWFTLYAAPDFMIALLLIALLCVQFHMFPPAFASGTSGFSGIFATPQALILPIIVLSINSVASFSQYTRSSMIEQLAEDYVRMARAKGLPERLVIGRHLLRNSLLPIVTILGLSLPNIVGGAVIAEAVFNFPGMGNLLLQSALSHDFPVLLGTTLVIATATVIGNLAADLAYRALDPRVRYERN